MTQDGWPGAWAAQERLERGAERLRSASGQAEDVAARVSGLTTRLKEVSGSGWTPDRAVVVTVDVAGRLTGLELGSRAYLMDPPALADVILRCVSQAQDEVAEEVSQIASRTWGEDSQLTRQIVQAVSVRPADAARERENYRRSPRRERLGMFDPDGIIRLRR